jgi:hypothetical protein
MVSIMPGIDTGAPERTDTSSGLRASPNVAPTSPSTAVMAASTSAASPAGQPLQSASTAGPAPRP